MKSVNKNIILVGISKLANFKFLISNFYTISNVLMSNFSKRIIVAFRNSNIKNSIEIRNLKLEIGDLMKSVVNNDTVFIYNNGLI